MNVLYLHSKPNRIDQLITVVLIISLVLDLLALNKGATCTMFKHKYVLLSSFTLWYFLQEIMRLFFFYLSDIIGASVSEK